MSVAVRKFDALLGLARRRNDLLERILEALEKDGSDGVEAGLRVGPMVDDPADHPGGTVMSLVLVIPDDKMVLVDVPLPLKDHGGNDIVGPDGAPWPAKGWDVTSENDAVAGVTPNDGKEPNFPPAGTGFWIRGRGLGQATCHLNLPLPDGQITTVDLLVNVVASAPQESSVAVGSPVDDPNPAA